MLTEQTQAAADSGGDDPTEVDPATWRLVTLHLVRPGGNVFEARMLRPLGWIEAAGATPGATIPLTLPDIEVEGMARVVAVEPCPQVQPGRGRVVTAAFTQLCPSVLSLKLRGLDTPLEPTAPHRFYSEDRQDWVAARDLRLGERLRTRQGQAAVVESIVAVPGVQRVYNLEVEAEHQFYVGVAGVLVHNAYNLPENRVPFGKTIDAKPGTLQEVVNVAIDFRVAEIARLRSMGDQASIIRAAHLEAGGGNVAVVRYSDGSLKPFINNQFGHSEMNALAAVAEQKLSPSAIDLLYSERSPCFGCQANLRTAQVPETSVYFSFDWEVRAAQFDHNAAIARTIRGN